MSYTWIKLMSDVSNPSSVKTRDQTSRRKPHAKKMVGSFCKVIQRIETKEHIKKQIL